MNSDDAQPTPSKLPLKVINAGVLAEPGFYIVAQRPAMTEFADLLTRQGVKTPTWDIKVTP